MDMQLPLNMKFLQQFLKENQSPVAKYIGLTFLMNGLKVILLLALGQGYALISGQHHNSPRTELIQHILPFALPSGMAFVWFYAILTIAFGGLLVAEKRSATLLGERFTYLLRAWIFDKQSYLKPSFFEKSSVGKQLVRYVGDLSTLQRWLLRGIFKLISDCFLTIGILTLILIFDAITGVLITTLMLVSGVLMATLAENQEGTNRLKRRRHTQMIDFLQEKLSVIASGGRISRAAKERFERKNNRLIDSTAKQKREEAFIEALVEGLPYFILTSAWAISALQISKPHLIIIVLLLAMFPAYRRLLRVPLVLKKGNMTFRRLAELEKKANNALEKEDIYEKELIIHN